MMSSRPQPISFCSFAGYRLLSASWWNELCWWCVGLRWTPSYNRDAAESWWRTLRMRRPGWVSDLVTYWHRARYGWAPRDTWSLDHYINRVLAGALEHLADTANGAPVGYGGVADDSDANFDAWARDLRSWAQAFREDPNDVDIFDAPEYVAHRAEESRRRENLHRALKDIEPHWESLWN